MCSPRQPPTPPNGITIAERNAELNRLSNDLAIKQQSGSRVDVIGAAVEDKQIKKILATPVDLSSAVFARTGTAGQTVAPAATSLEIAPSVLQGTLAKRATSTLRLPTITPVKTPAITQ